MKLPKAIVAAAALVALFASASGAQRADPRTPPGVPGLPPPFFGTALIGSGGLTAALDSYGDVVDLRPAPAGRPLITNSFKRQRAGTVPADTGISARIAIGGGRFRQLWEGQGYSQRYVAGTNVVRTAATIDGARVVLEDGIDPARPVLARRVKITARPGARITLKLHVNPGIGCRTGPTLWRGLGALDAELVCSLDGSSPSASGVLWRAKLADRRWISRATPLARDAPAWGKEMYARSLLVLRALTDRHSGAQAAGARDFWAYVWPRDAATGTMALDAAGYEPEARRVAGFLLGLDAGAAARFRGDGTPVRDGREPPGDSPGWIRAAASTTGLASGGKPTGWRARQDYIERDDERGDHLANAISAGVPADQLNELFGVPRGLVRTADSPGSGLDSAAGWATLPFPRPELHAKVLASLRQIAVGAGKFGIRPAERAPGVNPWTAPTAWTAAGLAQLDDQRGADQLLGALRRAATPAGLLPERVSRSRGAPLSTTPLAWSHAWAILALQARYGNGP